MIFNERQYITTKARIKEFVEAISTLKIMNVYQISIKNYVEKFMSMLLIVN